MRKYLKIFGINVAENAQYVFSSLFFELLFLAVLFFILASMWSHIFVGAEKIKGYSFEQILWYTILSESLRFGMNVQHCTSEVHYDIHSENIVMEIILISQ